MHEVFELGPVMDDDKRRGFYISDADRMSLNGNRSLLRDFFPRDRDLNKRSWQAQRLSPVWKSVRLMNPLPHQVNDYPCIGLTIPVYSARAVSVLRDLLEPNGELLPLDSDEGPDAYWAFNTTTVADVLDPSRSDVEWFATDRLKMKRGLPIVPVTAAQIHRYEFNEGALDGLSIFRLVEMSQKLYVTETFAQRVKLHELAGFDLRKVYPGQASTRRWP